MCATGAHLQVGGQLAAEAHVAEAPEGGQEAGYDAEERQVQGHARPRGLQRKVKTS